MPEFAIVLGQPISTASASTLKRWLSEVGIDPLACTWHTILRHGTDQKDAEIKAECARVLGELAAILDLKAVVVVGRFGVRLDTDLWRGGILKCHGHSGKLTLSGSRPDPSGAQNRAVDDSTGIVEAPYRGVNAIAMYDPTSTCATSRTVTPDGR